MFDWLFSCWLWWWLQWLLIYLRLSLYNSENSCELETWRTAEAKHVALASPGQEAVWVRQLSKDMNTFVQEPTIIFVNNQSTYTICMAQNPNFTDMENTSISWIMNTSISWTMNHPLNHEQVESNEIQQRYCQTENMEADILTKRMSQEKFIKLRDMCGLRQQPACIWEAVLECESCQVVCAVCVYVSPTVL